jgi:hypothetical protein
VTEDTPRTRRRVLLTAAGTLAAAGASFYAGMRFGRRPPPAYRRLTFRRGIVRSGRFLPGQQEIVYDAEWEGNAPRIFMTASGNPEGKALDIPPARLLSVSPGGELALKLEQESTLARVPVAGGTPTEVLRHIRWADWAPDGASFLIARQVGSQQRLEMPIGNVRYTTDSNIDYPRLSPDGKRIAFFEEPPGSGVGASLNVLELSGAKYSVPGHWNRHSGLAWNGSEIWFSASADNHAASIRAATLKGEIRPVFQMPIGAAIGDIAADGRFLFAGWTRRAVMMCEPAGEETARDFSWLDDSVSSDISSDGLAILFTESHSRPAVYFRKTDGSPAIRIAEGRALAFSPDTQWAAILDPANPRQLMLVHTGAGERRKLEAGRFTYHDARWFPDGNRLLVWANQDERLRRHYIQDAAGGPPRVVTAEGAAREAAISPDGEYVAAHSGPGVFLFPVDGTEPQPVKGYTAGARPIAWSDDARGLYLRRGYVVELVDLKTGKSEVWRDLTPPDPAGVTGIENLAIAPTGQAYVYSYQRHNSDLYVAGRAGF